MRGVVRAILDLGSAWRRENGRQAPFLPLAVATERYMPQVVLAAGRLGTLGVHVVDTNLACHNAGEPQPGNDTFWDFFW